MKIIIKKKKNNEKIRKFILIIPTFLIKSKFVMKLAMKSEHNVNNHDIKEIDYLNEYHNLFKNLYKEIKKYIKTNGHFTLFEVFNNELHIKIII